MKMLLAFLLISTKTDTIFLSLEKAKEMLKKQNLILKASQHQVKASYYDVKKSFGNFLPKLNFTAGYQYTDIQPFMETYVIDSFVFTPGGAIKPVFKKQQIKMGDKNQYRLELKLSQTLWTWGKLIYLYLLNKTNFELQKLNYEKNQKNLEYTIEKIYILTLIAKRFYILTLKIDTQLFENYKMVKGKYENGYASEIDLLQAEVKYKNNRKDINNAKTQFLNLKNTLKMLLNIPFDKEVILTTELKEDFDTAFYIENIEKNFEIRSLRYQKEILTYQKEIFKRKYLPDIAGSVSYIYQKPFWFENEWKGYWAASIGLNFNIFDGLQAFSEVKKINHQLKSIDFLLKNKENEIKKNYEEKLKEFKNAVENFNIAKENLKLAKKLYETAKKQYKSGYINYVQFLQAEDNYFYQKVNYLKSLADVYIAKIELQKVVEGF